MGRAGGHPLVTPAKAGTQERAGQGATLSVIPAKAGTQGWTGQGASPPPSFPRKREPRDGQGRAGQGATPSSFPRKREPRDGPGRGPPPRHTRKSGNPGMDRAGGHPLRHSRESGNPGMGRAGSHTPRHSRESGNPGTGRAGGQPLRHSRESGNPGMGRAGAPFAPLAKAPATRYNRTMSNRTLVPIHPKLLRALDRKTHRRITLAQGPPNAPLYPDNSEQCLSLPCLHQTQINGYDWK